MVRPLQILIQLMEVKKGHNNRSHGPNEPIEDGSGQLCVFKTRMDQVPPAVAGWRHILELSCSACVSFFSLEPAVQFRVPPH